jgi:hypothetical protein
VLVASFVGEGLYFIGMRNHATEHFHTLILFTLTMAAAGTASLGALVAMLPSIPAAIRGLGVVGVLVASLVFAPLKRDDYGNLHVPRKPDPGKPYLTEGETQARLLPRNSVVLVGSPGSQWLAYGAALGLQGHTMVCIDTFEDREWERVFDRAKASLRPVFAMIQHDSLPPETMAEIVRLGRVVTSGSFTTLYALANYDPATLPKIATTLPDSVLKETEFVAPTAAELAAAGIKYPFYGKGRGIWMSVPGENLAARATVGIVPFRPAPGLPRVRTAIGDFAYELRDYAQPPVVLGFGVRTQGSAETKAGLFVEKTIRPGDTAECRIAIPDGVDIAGFEISARRPDGEKSNNGASLNCLRIRFEY